MNFGDNRRKDTLFKRWESWARIAIKVFPYIKDKETMREVDCIEKLFGSRSYRKNARILDICCGWGRHCLELSNRNYNYVYGVDISKTFIEYAKNADCKKKIKFIRDDIMSLNFIKEFDVVLSFWHSIGLYDTKDDNSNFFKKIYTFLKPSGKLFIDAANGDRDLCRIEMAETNKYMLNTKHYWYLRKRGALALSEVEANKLEKMLYYSLSVYENIKEPKFKKRTMSTEIGESYFSTINEDDFTPGSRYWEYDNHQNVLRLKEMKKIFFKKNMKYRVYEAIISPITPPLFTAKNIFVRIYPKMELVDLLKASGFKICKIYGDFQMNKYSIVSPRLIVLAQKLPDKLL